MRVVVLVLISLLSACASQGPIHLYEGPQRNAEQLLTLDVPMELDIVRINQQPARDANRLLSYESRRLLLLPGDYQIEAFYKNVFDLADGGHQVVKSEPTLFRVSGNAGDHYRLDFVRPDNLEDARTLARDFRGWSIRMDDQHRQDSQVPGYSGESFRQSAITPMPGGSSSDSLDHSPSPSSAHYMDLLKAGWRQATPEERRDFLRWVSEQE